MTTAAVPNIVLYCGIHRPGFDKFKFEFNNYLLLSHCFYPFQNDKLKEFADNNFIFNEKGRKILKQAENTVRKGETPCDEQFLLLPQCFERTCTANT